MRMDVSVKLNLKLNQASDRVKKASKAGLRDAVVLMANDAVHDSPYQYGTNRRSLTYEVSGFPAFQPDGGKSMAPAFVSPTKTEAALYSTSGYGGFLETGTNRMKARPYIKPAFDRHKDQIPKLIKEHID